MSFLQTVDRVLTDELEEAIPVANVERSEATGFGYAVFTTNEFTGDTKQVRDNILALLTGKKWEPSTVTDKAFEKTLELHYIIMKNRNRVVMMVRWSVGDQLRLTIAPGVS